MSDKLKVAVLGGTGMVGQRFISIIENHPWFEVTTIAASPRSAGQTYEESVGKRWKMENPMPDSVKNIVIKDVTDVKGVSEDVDFVLSAVNMSKDEIKAIEEEYAKTETPVVSNNSAHRWTPDVPMIIPEINPDHMDVIEYQKKHPEYVEKVKANQERNKKIKRLKLENLSDKDLDKLNITCKVFTKYGDVYVKFNLCFNSPVIDLLQF